MMLMKNTAKTASYLSVKKVKHVVSITLMKKNNLF